jgi:HEAT repeat protein
MKMKRVLATAAVLLPVVLIVWLVLSPDRAPEGPVFQGTNLVQWLQLHEDASTILPRTAAYDNREAIIPAARNAIEAIGTNGIPTLLELLRSQELPVAARLREAVGSITGRRHLDAYGQRLLALRGFEILAERALAAAPALIELTNHKNSTIRMLATKCMGEIDPEGSSVLPSLVASLDDSDVNVRRMAANVILTRYPDHESAAKARDALEKPRSLRTGPPKREQP